MSSTTKKSASAVGKKNPDFFRTLPKVEAHSHLDGALRPELVLRLAKEQGHPLAEKSLEEIAKIVVVSSARDSLKEVLDAFFTIYPLLKVPAAMEEAAYEACRQANNDHALYFETRFAPSLMAGERFGMDEILDGALKGLARGRKDFGVSSGVIITMLRDHPLKENEAMFQLACRYKDKGVVGLDLANHESASSFDDYADFYREAKRQGLFTTVHAGEVYPSPDLPAVLRVGIDRIGHGVFLPKYPDLLQEVAWRKIPIEVNLTSNVRTAAVKSYQEHPLPKFLELGIPVILNTDDYGIFGIDLTHEYQAAAKELQLSPAELCRIARNGIDTLFCSDERKTECRRLFDQQSAGLCF
ncbi:MAG: adenosine deaminase [Elusimicrobia bacterium]|nr:adenosine deaminase [Elusimicrobiota bacterium]